MRCRSANAVLAIAALLIPAAGRLLAVRKVSPEATKEVASRGAKEVASKISPHILPTKDAAEPVGPKDTKDAAERAGCPAACNCHHGEAANGGAALVSGTCLSFCSEAYEGLRYCGHSADYRDGDYIDCRECNDPAHFGSQYKLHKPPGEAKGSLILLAPWNASLGWGKEWLVDNSTTLEPSLKQQYRILDVQGRKMPRTDFTSWYNYDGDDAWHSDNPLMPEVDLAISYVHQLIEQEYKIVGDYRRIVLFGLSQGASLALESALRFPHALGLVFSQRGALFDSRRKNSTAVAHTPYILTVGAKDHYYHVDLLKACCEHLKNEQASVFMKTIPGIDHYEWSKSEWILSVKAFAAALASEPTPALSKLTDWTVSP